MQPKIVGLQTPPICVFLKGKNGLRDYRDERAITW